MSEELFSAGLSAAQQGSAKLNDIFTESYNQEVDLMFGRLHEQRSNPQSSDYSVNNYNKDDYKRVGFHSRKEASQFVKQMESLGVETVVSPVKLNGQYLVEIPKVNQIPLAPESGLSGVTAGSETASESGNQYEEHKPRVNPDIQYAYAEQVNETNSSPVWTDIPQEEYDTNSDTQTFTSSFDETSAFTETKQYTENHISSVSDDRTHEKSPEQPEAGESSFLRSEHGGGTNESILTADTAHTTSYESDVRTSYDELTSVNHTSGAESYNSPAHEGYSSQSDSGNKESSFEPSYDKNVSAFDEPFTTARSDKSADTGNSTESFYQSSAGFDDRECYVSDDKRQDTFQTEPFSEKTFSERSPISENNPFDNKNTIGAVESGSSFLSNTSKASASASAISGISGKGSTAVTAGGVALETVTADELIDMFKRETFIAPENPNSREGAESCDAIGGEVSSLFNYMAAQTGELGSTLSAVNKFYKETAKVRPNADADVFKNELKANGNVNYNAGRSTETAIVLNNDTVIVRGKIVTDEKTREYVLKQHRARVEKAEKYVHKDALQREKWIEKGSAKKNPESRTAEDWVAHRDGRKIQNHQNRAKNSQAILDNVYKQEYRTLETKNFASKTGGSLDSIVEGFNFENAVLTQTTAIALTADEVALIKKVSSRSADSKALEIGGVLTNGNISTFKEQVVVKSMLTTFQQQNSMSSKMGRLLKKYEGLEAGKTLTPEMEKKLGDDLVKDLKKESMKDKYSLEVSKPVYDLAVKFERGEISYQELKDELKKIADKKTNLSASELETLKKLTGKNSDGTEGGKLAFSKEAAAMFGGNLKMAESLSKDFKLNLKDGMLTRADLLRINTDFINRAAAAGYQFITPTGKFDTKMLNSLGKEDLLRLGISNDSRKALIKLNEKGAWGGKNKNMEHTGIGKGLASKGMQLVGDEDLNKIVQTSSKSIGYVRQARTSVKQFSRAMETKIDTIKAKNAARNGKSGNGNIKEPKPKNPSTKKARPVNEKRNEKFIKNQEKKLKSLERSENGIVGKARKKINGAKQKVADSKVVKLANKVITAVKKFLIKFIVIALLVAVILEGVMLLIAFVLTAIESLVECLSGIVGAIVPDYFDTSAVFQLYESLQEEEETWLELVEDFDSAYEARQDLKYGLNYEDFQTYITSFENLTVDGSNTIYINPFWQAGGAVSLSSNSDALTELDGFNGVNTVQLSANTNAYGKKTDTDIYGTYTSTESGHTSNLKDILSMLDVMYQFETDEASDEGLESVMGMSPAEIDWENFKNNVGGFFKWAGTNISEWWSSLWGGGEPQYISFDDAKGNSVSYKTLQNYVAHLFELSHQQQYTMSVDYYPVEKVNANVNGTMEELDVTVSEGCDLGVCTEPVTKKFKLYYNPTSNKIVPCIIDSSGGIHDLSTGDFDVILSLTNGTYDDDDQCLKSGMGNNEATLEFIKNSACWYYANAESSTYAQWKSFSGDYWRDSEDEAKNDVINKMINEYNACLSNPSRMGTPTYTLSADKNKFTHVWYRLFNFNSNLNSSDISWISIPRRQVKDGYKAAQYYWTTQTGGSLTTNSSTGNRVRYIFTSTSGSLPSMDGYDCSLDWFEDIKRLGYVKSWYYTDESFNWNNFSWQEDGYFTYWDCLDGWSMKTKYGGASNVTLYPYVFEVETKVDNYKTQYKVTEARVHLYDKITDIYNRDCEGHDFTYCGGHLGLHSQGIVYSMTNEQLGMAGCYDDKAQYPVIQDFDFDAYGYGKIIGKHDLKQVDWTSAGTASRSGGSKSPLVDVQGSYPAQRGLNLYADGAEFKKGYKVREDDCMQLIRDIFDVDCMVDKGCNVFPFGSSYEEYEGWNADNMTLALARTSVDWYGLYEFDIPIEVGGMTVARQDIKKILDALEAHYGADFDEDRRAAVELALYWVGRGHYSENHKDHAFLSQLCDATDVNRYINGVPTNMSYDANCTASDDEGFVKFILNRTGQLDDISQNLYGWRTYGNTNDLKPADILVHEGGGDYREIQISGSGSSSWYIHDTLKAYSEERYVFYVGVIDEDIELRGMSGETITLKAGEPITIDLNMYDGVGTIRLRSESATSWDDLGDNINYYWVTNPDSHTKFRKYN